MNKLKLSLAVALALSEQSLFGITVIDSNISNYRVYTSGTQVLYKADFNISASGNSTLTYVVTGSATKPSIAQVKAGQNNTGGSPFASGSATLTANTLSSTTFSNLIANFTQYFHYVVTDTSANDTNVSTYTVTTPNNGNSLSSLSITASDYMADHNASYTFSFTTGADLNGSYGSYSSDNLIIANNPTDSNSNCVFTLGSVSGASLANYVTVKINGVTQNINNILDTSNGVWTGGIQLQLKSGFNIAAGSDINITVDGQVMKNPSTNDIYTFLDVGAGFVLNGLPE